MNPFYKSFLRDEDGWRRGRDEPRIFVAAFGKHPGWDDHMDDIGLDTESLAILKRMLYLQGIAQNIGAGVWEREPKRLVDFNHLFRWQRGEQFMLGRIHASRDGKGRARFPFVVCAHVLEKPAPSSEVLEGCLEETLVRCLNTGSQGEVKAALEEALEYLRRAEAGPDAEPFTLPLEYALNEKSLNLDRYKKRRFRPWKDLPSLCFRLSRPEGLPAIQLAEWMRTLYEKIDPEIPILLLAPLDSSASWVDVILGEPVASDFACLLRG